MTERRYIILATAIVQALYEVPLHGGTEHRIYTALRDFGITDSSWAILKSSLLKDGLIDMYGHWVKLTPKGEETAKKLCAIYYSPPSSAVH